MRCYAKAQYWLFSSVLGGLSICVGSSDLEWPWKAGCKGSKFSGRNVQLCPNGLT